MKSVTNWPKHLYLIASGTAAHQHKPTLENMGSKAFNLARMADIGLPVPPALVIGTHYTKSPDECMLPVFSVGLPALEEATGLAMRKRRCTASSTRSTPPSERP